MQRLLKTGAIMLAIFLTVGAHAQYDTAVSRKLAQQQLDAYNAHDIEAFLAPYSDSVRMYKFPGQLVGVGKEMMRESYAALFKNLPDLYCNLVNRMVMNDIVIDQESLVIDKKRPSLQAIAIYRIRDGKIVEVTFIQD